MRTLLTILITLFTLTNLLGQQEDTKLQISQLTGDFYVYTTYNKYNGYLVPSNSMYVVSDKGVILIDTPWDSTQFQPLLDGIKVKHNQKAVICISTHSHSDRTAGLEYFKKQGIKTYTTRKTDNISKTQGEKRAEFIMEKDTVFTVGNYTFRTYYPGEGHTSDNIIVWFEKDKVLFGGCLIKSIESTNLGYIGEANPKEWPASIKNIQKNFREHKYIIPGHGNWTSNKALDHTLMLLEEFNK